MRYPRTASRVSELVEDSQADQCAAAVAAVECGQEGADQGQTHTHNTEDVSVHKAAADGNKEEMVAINSTASRAHCSMDAVAAFAVVAACRCLPPHSYQTDLMETAQCLP